MSIKEDNYINDKRSDKFKSLIDTLDSVLKQMKRTEFLDSILEDEENLMLKLEKFKSRAL